MRHGTLPGEILLRYHPFRSPSTIEVQTRIADPNVDAKWQHAGLFNSGMATAGGLTPVTAVWFRVLTAGLKGVIGAWSDPARIIVAYPGRRAVERASDVAVERGGRFH